MNKSNATLVVAIAFITISTLVQGMKRKCEQEIVLTNTYVTNVHRTFTKKNIFHSHITMSPESQYPKSITTRYYGPSIMTALYAKYKSGMEFVGITNCRVSDFLSNFDKVFADLNELCNATIQQNNLPNITAVTFWYLTPGNLSGRLDHLGLQHYNNHKTQIFKNIENLYGIRLVKKAADYYDFEPTHPMAQMKVTLSPEEGTIEFNDQKCKL